MKITINRFDGKKSYKSEFDIERVTTLLGALYSIKEQIDPTLTFSSGCRSGICGACAMLKNGKEVLACSVGVDDGDEVAPLKYHKVLKDLKVDKSQTKQTLKRANSYLHRYKEAILNSLDEKSSSTQSDCILCDSCYSACPVFAINEQFLGPFALTRAYRYAIDKREDDTLSIIQSIQNSGVWDCTLCGECTAVCPQNIDPKSDILNLRSISMQNGFSDPNMMSMNFGSPF